MIPFMIDVMESAHQIPLRPIRPPNIIASGILALVKAMLMILQSLVLPSPDKAPTVVSSTHIKASLKPMITRYPTAVATAFGSWKKISAIAFGKHLTNCAIPTIHVKRVKRDSNPRPTA